MKKPLLALCLLLLWSSSLALAAVYQWTDAEGVTHFTDDPEIIPRGYRHKAIRRESNGKVKPPPQAAVPEIVVPAAPAPRAPAITTYDGHAGEWWRDRFQMLRSELKSLQDGADKKQEQMVQLRRKRAIYMRARDREAINSLQSSIDLDSARMSKLQQELQTLERSADDAGVPAMWRQ